MKRRLPHRAATEITASEAAATKTATTTATVMSRGRAHHRAKTDENHRRH
jgi:hypothetical protein